jgi:hypothetical protein
MSASGMVEITENTYEQVYNIREDESVSSGVAIIVCALVQRGLLVAGFDNANGLQTLHYYGYNTTKPVWELDFFEQLFNTEPLLAAKEKIKGFFISSSKNLIVPDELFSENEAKSWLKHLYFIEPSDVINAYPLENDKAQYLYAVPVNILELVKINFKKAAITPLACYHFNMEQIQSLYLQCCISNGQALCTLHNYSQLLWHKRVDYSAAEDIAYEIKLMCKENYIDAARLNIVCNAISAAEYGVINDLTQYFPSIKAGNGLAIHGLWDPAISLANQLLECVL